jgi:hypothetical protein
MAGETEMVVRVDRTGSVTRLASLLAELEGNETIAGILLLACDENGFQPHQVDDLLLGVTKPIFGGVFPQIVHEYENLSLGTIAVGLTRLPHVLTVPGLSDPAFDFDTFFDAHTAQMGHGQTMFVWVDGLSERVGELIESLYHIFGLEYTYIGGGAGSLSFDQKPCLFTNQGLIGDSAVLAVLDSLSGVGVSHGWSSISGPYKVTHSTGSVIHSLNWRPAFDVYAEAIAQNGGPVVTRENFAALSKSHPFGIIQLGGETVVRDPIVLREDGALVCVGDVSQESHVDILTGDPLSLIEAARKAFASGQAAFGESEPSALTFFVDCITRVLFLDKEFDQELAAVHSPGKPLVGVLSLGEVANSGHSCLEFYNKTAVVGILGVV